MPHKILEGRQHTAPEGCLSEKSTRRSPKKKYHHRQKAEAASAASAGGQRQNAVPRHGVLADDRPPNKIFRHTFLLLKEFHEGTQKVTDTICANIQRMPVTT